MDTVEARAARHWWHAFVAPASYEQQAHERLSRRARKAGGNGVRITEYRAFKGPNKGDGVERVEIEGEVLDCPGEAPET